MYDLDGCTNWKGQPAHPIDCFCNFQTTDKDRDRMITIFDALAQGDTGKAKLLDELLSQVSSERATEEAFNYSEDA